MKKVVTTLYCLLQAVSLAVAAQHPAKRHGIEDAPVPIDGTYVRTCQFMEVKQPKDCKLTMNTEFEVKFLLGEPLAGRAALTVGGIETVMACTVDVFEKESCEGQTSLKFRAKGSYEICLTIDAFPASEIGGEWDDFGDENEDPDALSSDLHHWTELRQDCGLIQGGGVHLGD